MKCKRKPQSVTTLMIDHKDLGETVREETGCCVFLGRSAYTNESKVLLAPTGHCGCHSGAEGCEWERLSSQLAAAGPNRNRCPARQWTVDSCPGMVENGCSQQTETGLWVEHRFKTKTWVSPLRQGLKRKERRTIQERKREVQRHPSSSGQGPKWRG